MNCVLFDGNKTRELELVLALSAVLVVMPVERSSARSGTFVVGIIQEFIHESKKNIFTCYPNFGTRKDIAEQEQLWQQHGICDSMLLYSGHYGHTRELHLRRLLSDALIIEVFLVFKIASLFTKTTPFISYRTEQRSSDDNS